MSEHTREQSGLKRRRITSAPPPEPQQATTVTAMVRPPSRSPSPADEDMFLSNKLMICVTILAFAVYIYFLLFLKNMYLKNQRLDRIMEMITETEQKIDRVFAIDRNMAYSIERYYQLHPNL